MWLWRRISLALLLLLNYFATISQVDSVADCSKHRLCPRLRKIVVIAGAGTARRCGQVLEGDTALVLYGCQVPPDQAAYLWVAPLVLYLQRRLDILGKSLVDELLAPLVHLGLELEAHLLLLELLLTLMPEVFF